MSTSHRALYRKIVLLGVSAILATWMTSSAAVAQPNPSNMRSGIATATGFGMISIFNVPAGQYFVLTDLDWNPSVLGSGDFITTVSIVDSTVRWSRPATIGAGVIFLPSFHNTTGIVVNAGLTVFIGTNNTIPSNLSWTASWSGYLVSAMTGAIDTETETGKGLSINATPNPTQGVTNLALTLAAGASVVLAVYSVDGECVRTLHRGPLEKGDHVFTWDGRDDAGRSAARGVYFAKLQSEEGEDATRITLVH